MSRFVGFPLKMGFGPRNLKFFKEKKVLALEALYLKMYQVLFSRSDTEMWVSASASFLIRQIAFLIPQISLTP